MQFGNLYLRNTPLGIHRDGEARRAAIQDMKDAGIVYSFMNDEKKIRTIVKEVPPFIIYTNKL